MGNKTATITYIFQTIGCRSVTGDKIAIGSRKNLVYIIESCTKIGANVQYYVETVKQVLSRLLDVFSMFYQLEQY